MCEALALLKVSLLRYAFSLKSLLSEQAGASSVHSGQPLSIKVSGEQFMNQTGCGYVSESGNCAIVVKKLRLEGESQKCNYLSLEYSVLL